MRINKFIALALGVSRREADNLVADGKISVNDKPCELGYHTKPGDDIRYQGKSLKPADMRYVLVNKPTGVVTSRAAQNGAQTIYDILPTDLFPLKPVGRLDKESSGVLLLTNDGDYAHTLTHPSFKKQKTYVVQLDKPLTPEDHAHINKSVELPDGTSNMKISGTDKDWKVRMHEGRNRQIRRTFKLLGYEVVKLHRTHFGSYSEAMLDGELYKKTNKREH